MYDEDLPTASDFMTTSVFSLSPEKDVFEAVDQLLKRHFAAAPVVDEDNRVLGVLTEKDCLRILSNRAYGDDLEGGKVSDFQSPTPLVCEPHMDIFGVVDRLLSTNFPLLPVVKNEKLVGVVSRRDTLRGIKELKRRIDLQREKSEKAAGTQADRPRSIENLQRAAGSTTKEQLARLFGRK